MNKKVLVLSASPRKNGNSDLLCDSFIKGAAESDNQTEKIFLQNKIIKNCIACDICKNNGGNCIQKDDAAVILEKMIQADIVVLATPVYFYSMNGQLKTLIDRTYSLYTEMKNKEFYFILTGAAPEKSYMETAVAGLDGFVSCVPDAKVSGIVYGVNTVEKGDVLQTYAMDEAYEMGKKIQRR